MGDSSRGGRKQPNMRPTRGGAGGYHVPAAAPSAGIKSGMTVEDLKRLTQKRMQESAAAANAAVASMHSGEVLTPKAKPTISVPHGTPQQQVASPFVPKNGMSVQELKQLTTLRLASQTAGTPTHQQQTSTPTAATSSDYKAMLQNYYARVNTPTSSPGSTPRRQAGGRGFASEAKPKPVQAQSKPGNNTIRAAAGSRNRAQSIERSGYNDFGISSPINQGYDPIPDPPESGFSRHSIQFEDESFPPPPPMDEMGSFGAPTAMPSWSPPPMRTKTMDARPVSLYHQSNFYAQQPAPSAPEDNDLSAFVAPPPGLTRRPSMTVPWQVAESVLHTPQQPTGRKQIVSVPETPFHQFAQAYPQTIAASPPRMPLHRGISSGTSAAAAAAAAELNAVPPNSTPLVRQTSKENASNNGQPQLTRRGSFGNAAQMFKFRRRSKSRLDFARDLALMEHNGSDTERMLSIEEREMLAANDLYNEGEQERHSTSTVDLEDLKDLRVMDDFMPFFNSGRGGPKLSIPPPPPPPVEDNEETGLPMMSPNGAKLRKVAQLARSGSLSTEDKTRVKDEIIQNSLGIMSLMPDELNTIPPGFSSQSYGKKSPSRGIARNQSRAEATPAASSVSLEDRLAQAAQRVADCVAKSDMVEFQKAMDELDKLRHEASQMMQQ
ncbi:hypothetical protein Ae201684P_001908 [Aphanomyces euteiches]|uniref:Uncharacterized protein n=1 Tax=Aphanomyces euteiches TaxID=100861 RepID=A0A6G0XJQ2_9STRA|nr:hypothetical protein Ae201684_003943 [Aphanomyces euteiches]KAH9084668.1 hypothetical protein Ae201684P_001908 [Aphanomyces euteiches]KAH9157322.1 hypothetical protein AeRB84_000852 [Aphanomyces euteiches]